MKNIILFILIAFIIIFGAGCSLTKKSSTTTTPTTNDFTSQDSQVIMSKTKANLDKAKAAASVWKGDATWVALNFKVPANLNPKSLTQTFVFGAPSDPDNWFTYSIDTEDKFVRAVIPKSDFLSSNLNSIDDKYWQISYSQALQIADENGGTAYRAQNPEAETTLTLAQGDPKNWVWYVIAYSSTSGSQKIRISANDGKIYNDQGELVQ